VDILERDERFWQEQQARLTRQIGQPCCSLSGMSTLLVAMPGNFAVVMHGESDCANCFLQTQGPSGAKFYSSKISQLQFTTGQTAEPLRRCLELVIAQKSPDAVFVLGNCLMEMIHDDFDSVAKEVEERTGTPVLPLRTHGLEAGSQAKMVDWLYSTLASLSEKHGQASGKNGRLNLIGLPELQQEELRSELFGILQAAELEVNGSYPFQTSLEDWQRIGRAEASFVVDRGMYPQLVSRLEAMGQDCIEIPLPVGLENSLDLLRAIGKRFKAEKKVMKAAEAKKRALSKRLVAFKKRFGGLRAALGLRMVNNYRADQLAYDGLGDFAFFVEAGFAPTLFIQGPPEEKARRHFQERLEQLGCRLPFHIFPDPFDLPKMLKAGRFDVAYLADHAKREARQAGVPLIPGRSLEPFFAGAVRNLDYIEQVLSELGTGSGGRKVVD